MPSLMAADYALADSPNFARAHFIATHGAAADRRAEREAGMRWWRERYTDALRAARMRLRDGSIQRYQLAGLTRACTTWRACCSAELARTHTQAAE